MRSSMGGQVEKAMILMVLAMLILPGIDAIAKTLGGSLSAGQITWSRFFFQVLLMFPLFIRAPGPIFGPGFRWHFARGFLQVVAMLFFVSGLRYLPLAESISIFFVEPLILTLMASVFLKEPIGWRRLSAVAVGFAGALIVIRPNFELLGWVALLPMAAAVCVACYMLITRLVAQREEPGRMQFYSGFYGCVVMTVALCIGEAHPGDLSMQAGGSDISGFPNRPTARK